MRRRRKYTIEGLHFQQNALVLQQEKFTRRTNSVFFLFLSYTFAYLHFYTIIRMMVHTSEPSNERECGIHTEKKEKKRERESEYPISYIHIALYVV